MPQVEIAIGGRSFEVSCQPGEEAFLRTAAELLDAEATALSSQIGRMPEARMLLMAGLMLADKTAGLEDRLRDAEARVEELGAQAAEAQARVVVQTVEVPVEVTVEVPVEVPVIPDEVARLFADIADEAEALSRSIASLLPPTQAAAPA